MVKHAVVINSIAVHPISAACLISCASNIVDVDEFWMFGHNTIVVFGLVVILNQVVPCMPFPDDFSIIGTDRLDLDDVVRPNVVLSSGSITRNGRISSGLEGFFFGSVLPSDHQQVSIGHWLDVVV